MWLSKKTSEHRSTVNQQQCVGERVHNWFSGLLLWLGGFFCLFLGFFFVRVVGFFAILFNFISIKLPSLKCKQKLLCICIWYLAELSFSFTAWSRFLWFNVPSTAHTTRTTQSKLSKSAFQETDTTVSPSLKSKFQYCCWRASRNQNTEVRFMTMR